MAVRWGLAKCPPDRLFFAAKSHATTTCHQDTDRNAFAFADNHFHPGGPTDGHQDPDPYWPDGAG